MRLRGLPTRSAGCIPTRLQDFMYLLYLDDAGSPGNKNEDYFVLGGICVYEAQVEWFGRELDKLGAQYNASTPEDVEFHASEIFSRRVAPWKSLSSDEARGTLKWSAPEFETQRQGGQLPFDRFYYTSTVPCCRMSLAGEAEVGSAGEQPTKEYPAGNSFR